MTPADHQQIAALGRRARAWRSDGDGSREAIAELVARAQAGDTAAEGEVLLAHTPHVRGVCWRLRVRRLDLDDMVQDGLLAMRTPISRFDGARGVPLWAYARPFVKGEVVFRLGASAGLTRHQSRHYRAIWDARDALAAESADPTAGPVYDRLRQSGHRGAGPATVAAVLDAGRRRPLPLDERRGHVGSL